MSSLNKTSCIKKFIFCHYWSNINHAGTVKEGPKGLCNVCFLCSLYGKFQDNVIIT